MPHLNQFQFACTADQSLKQISFTEMEKSELPKLRVLQSIQKNFAMLGIVPALVTQTFPLNEKVFLDFSILSSAIICNFTYTFSEANTFVEYTQSIFMSTLAALINFALLILILNIEKLFGIFNGFEDIANTSQCDIFNIFLNQFHSSIFQN